MRKKNNFYLSVFSVGLLSFSLSCSAGNPTTPNRANLTNLAKSPQTTTEVNKLKEINFSGRVLDAVTRKPVENANVLVYVITNENIINSLKANPKTSPAPEAVKEPEIKQSVPPPPVLPPAEEEEETKGVKKLKNTSSSLENKKSSPTPVPSGEPEKSETKEEPQLLNQILAQLKPNDLKEFKTTTNNEGKFWLNNVPDSTMVITVSSPEHRALSVFNVDSSKIVDILLPPSEVSKYTEEINGSVFSVNNLPLENALVCASFVPGESFSVPTLSNGLGEFNLVDIPVGERTIFASLRQNDGKIVSLGKSNFILKKIEKKAEEKKELKKSDQNYPLVSVSAVENYLKFSGKIVNLGEKSKLKSINVYVTFKKKGQPQEQVFLVDYPLNEKKEDFSLELPELEKGYYYNLEFVSTDAEGLLSYSHLNNLSKESKELKVSFLPALGSGIMDFLPNGEEKLPIFSWPEVSGADFYKISLERIDEENNAVTLWEGVTPFNTAIYPITSGKGKMQGKFRYSWTVAAIKEQENTKKADKLIFEKLNIPLWTALSRSPLVEFTFTEEPQIEELDSLLEEKNTGKKN